MPMKRKVTEMTSKVKKPGIFHYDRTHATVYQCDKPGMKLSLSDVGTVIGRMWVLCPRYELRHVGDVTLYEYDARGKAIYRNGLLLVYIFKCYTEERPPKIQILIPEFASKNEQSGHFVQVSLVHEGKLHPDRTTMVSLSDARHPAWSFNSEIAKILLACTPSNPSKENTSIGPLFNTPLEER